MRCLKWILPTLLFGTLLQAAPAEELLKQVDRLRYPWPSFSAELELKAGKLQQRWLVRVRENGDARVEGLSEKEKGRTVLLLGDQMWLLLPNAKKPVKVSPQQRLLGPAAGGDIARFRFAADYTVSGDSSEALDGKTCRRIELQAKRPSISFRTATLWTTLDGKPLKAEFFLPSGKLAKIVKYGPLLSAHGLPVLSGLELEEPSGRSAGLRFGAWKPVPAEDALFLLPTESK